MNNRKQSEPRSQTAKILYAYPLRIDAEGKIVCGAASVETKEDGERLFQDRLAELIGERRSDLQDEMYELQERLAEIQTALESLAKLERERL